MNDIKKSGLLEKIAVTVAGVIIFLGVYYWIMQIHYANEMLKLAHPD